MTRRALLRQQYILALAITAAMKSTASALVIVPTYTSNITSLPNASQVEAAFSYAIQQYENTYASAITINITLDTETTGLSNSSFTFGNSKFTYAQMRNALIAHDTTNDQTVNIAQNWPTTDPIAGTNQWEAPTAQQKALGLLDPNNAASDGTITFNTNLAYTFDPFDRTVATGTTYDFVGAAEHEIAEIMGRTQGLGTIKNGIPTYETLDLNRYNAPGVHDFIPSDANSYFSIDGGTTNLKGYNSTAPGDAWDWVGPTTTGAPGYIPDAFNAFSSSGATNSLTPVDSEVMDVLGYTHASTNLTFKSGFNDFLAGNNWQNANSVSVNPFRGAAMIINDPNATAFHEFTPGENFVLASNSDMGDSMEVKAGFLELNDSGQVAGSGFGLLVNQDGALLVDGTGDLFPQGPVSIGDAAGVTSAIAQFSASGTVIIGNPAQTVGFTVGNAGAGSVTQTGASNVTTPSLTLGFFKGSSGTYLLNTTGTLDVTGNEVVGNNGSGDFQQIAGTNKITGALIVGEQFGIASFELQGGAVTAADVQVIFTVFNAGPTTFTQSGGTLDTPTLTIHGATYNLSNGTCEAAAIDDSGILNFGGGLVLGNITNNNIMTYTGGSLIGSFTNNGVTNLNASFTVPFSMGNNAPLTINSGITLTVNLSGIDNESTIVLNNGTLAGNGEKSNDDAITGHGTISGSGALINNGTIAESGGSIVLGLAGTPYTNNGTIVLQTNTGELDISTPNSPTSDRLINAGQVALDNSVIDGAGGFENASGGTVVGPGKINNAYFVNDSGATVSLPEGTLNIVPSFSNAGTIDLADSSSNLTGGAITNSGTIEGIGTVASTITNTGTIEPGAGTLTLSGSITNSFAGTISIPSGGTVLVTEGLAANGGTINLAGGTFDNNGNSISNQGQITGFGTFNANTITNGHFGDGTITLSGGDSTINANVNNVGTVSVTGGSALFNGNVTSGNSIQATNTTLTVAGTLSSFSYVSSGSVNNFQNNVSLIGTPGAIMSGGDSDLFTFNNGTFTINSQATFSNTGQFESGDPVVNNGTFLQNGPSSLFIQSGDFNNNGNAVIGGEQLWFANTNFNNSGTATFQTDAGAPGTSTLTVNVTAGSVVLASPQHWAGLTITGGVVDVANNHLFIHYGDGPDPIASIAAYLQEGYNAGTWTGPGINSSTAAENSSYALGYADGADGVVTGLTSGDIEILYTLYGDANLDGVVSGDDFTILASNLGKAVNGWDQGDFNYDGVVSGDDFTLLIGNLGKAANGAAITLPAGDLAAIDAFAAAHGLMADVPEPAMLSFTMLFAAGALMRRRRIKLF
jgi:hypothetical protein